MAETGKMNRYQATDIKKINAKSSAAQPSSPELRTGAANANSATLTAKSAVALMANDQ
jgi:hypothetical protein